MQTLTAEEFKNKYGLVSLNQFEEDEKKESLFGEIKSAFAQGIGKIGQGYQEAKPLGDGGVEGLVTGTGKILGGAAEVVASPAAPILNRTIGKAINFVGDKLSNIPGLQKFAMSPAGEKTEKVAATVSDYANAAGIIAGGPKVASGVAKAPGKALSTVPKPNVSGATKYASQAVRDVVPNTQNLIDHNIAKALDLTPGDLTKIGLSTGNEVGPWMAQNNLIGTNKTTTLGLIKGFFTDNYAGVRNEIGKVDTVYQQAQVPRYTDVLTQLAVETQGKLGLESITREINTLLKKEGVSLSDVQRVKELLDEHFSLYKVTGDVQTGITKQGLANVRDEIKTFIESEVAKSTGADIRAMNNNVSTARSLADAIEARSPRGLTRAQLTWRDAAIGMGLTYFGSPIAGLAAVAVWKITTSPSARLRFARWLDGLNDAKRASVSQQFKTGDLSQEVKDVLELKNGEKLPTP